MENQAPFTVGTDIDAQPRTRPASTKSPAQMHIDAQTPLLQGSDRTQRYGESRIPGDSADAPVIESGKSWRKASVSNLVI